MVPGTIFLGKAKPGLLRGLAGVPLDPLGVSVALVATVPKSRENLRSGKERVDWRTLFCTLAGIFLERGVIRYLEFTSF